MSVNDPYEMHVEGIAERIHERICRERPGTIGSAATFERTSDAQKDILRIIARWHMEEVSRSVVIAMQNRLRK